jgi:hypothetical protein
MGINEKGTNIPPAPEGEPGAGWIARNPGKTIFFTILAFILLVDWIAGWILIPRDYNSFRCPHYFYHHDLLPNRAVTARWGDSTYPLFTNSLGFRDASVRTVELQSPRKRILFLGDSFVEGMGLPYKQTFVGLLGEELRPSGIEVLDAGVVSYSPKLYYLKTKYLLEKRRLRFDRLFVFIDNSDIPNEISYEAFEPQPFTLVKELAFQLKKFLKKHSFFYYSFSRLLRRSRAPLPGETTDIDGLFPCLAGLGEDLMNNRNFRRSSRWSIHPEVFAQFGRKGLRLAKDNMRKLADLCRQNRIDLTIAVYPWPVQIRHNAPENIQASFWRDFARESGIGFINLFPDFVNKQSIKAIRKKYFIPGDVHWNAAGHRLVADRVLEYIRSPGH